MHGHQTRRDFMQTGGALALLAATTPPQPASAAEEARMSAAAFDHQHTRVPLPFDVKSLRGLSEKMMQSHWENNYSGAVNALNTVRGRLSQALSDANTPP